jgi:hypothetical protein
MNASPMSREAARALIVAKKWWGVKQINFKQPFTVIISDPESMAEAKNLIDPIKS